MTTRLPIVDGDEDGWGTILNNWALATHNNDGTHKLGDDLVTENVNTVASSGSSETLPSSSTATIHNVTLTNNCTFTFPTAVAGHSFILVLTQDATGGRTVTWPSNILWPEGGEPELSAAGNSVDVLSFVCVDGTNWLGFPAGFAMAQAV
jgi:hypothetical protein